MSELILTKQEMLKKHLYEFKKPLEVLKCKFLSGRELKILIPVKSIFLKR